MKARAEATGVWLIVDATAEWCGPCKQLDRITWRDGEVVRWIEDHGLAVQVDVDAESELAKRLEIRAMPTIVAFKNGEEKDRIVGYRDPKGLLEWLGGLARGETDLDRLQRSVVDPEHDVRGRMSLARALSQAGRKDEATEELVWLWQNMARVEPAMNGVRLSYLAGDIKSLTGSHAPAHARFVSIRDALESANLAGSAGSRLDWIVLNALLGEQERTLGWYDAVKWDPASAAEIERGAHHLIELLVERKRWADVGRIYRDPLAELARRHAMTTLPRGAEIPPERLTQLQETMARHFRDNAALLAGCLRAAGRATEAEALEREALRLDPSNEMKLALASSPTPEAPGTSSDGRRNDILKRAGRLTELGIRKLEQGQRGEAVAATREAVALYRQLAAESPAFIGALAGSLANLGGRLKGPSERAEALAAATEAVTLFRQITGEGDSPESLPGLAVSLHNLAIRQREAELHREALATATESVEVQSRLAARDPGGSGSPLAGALINLGSCQSALGMSEQALESTSRAVTIYRERAAASDTFLPGLAGALVNLGVQQNSLGLKEAALQTGLEAAALRRRIAARNPDQVAARSELAMCLTNLEAYQGGLGLRKEAMATALEAVALHRGLVASNPNLLPNLATGLLNLSASQSRVGLRREALDSIAEAVVLFTKLNAEKPGAFDPNLAMSLVNLGVQQGAVGRLQEALESTEEAVTIRRRLAANNPGVFLSRLGMSLNNLGTKRTRLGLHAEALAAATEAVSLFRTCADENPSAFRPRLAEGLDTLGEVQIDLGQEAAIATLAESIAIRRELARALPRAFEPGLAKTLSQLGTAQRAAGRASEAVETIAEAVTIQRRLVATDEASFLPDLATSLDNLGVSRLADGSPREALAAATEAVALHRRLADAQPESFLSHLAKSLFHLAMIHGTAGRQDEALPLARKAASIYEPLAARFPGAFSLPLGDARAAVRQALEQLGLPLDDSDQRPNN